MHLYVLIPMLSCVVSAVLLGSIYRRGAAHRPNQLVSVIFAGGTLFCFCEAILSGVEDPGWAMAWVRVAALGWAFSGPVALQLLLEVTGARIRTIEENLPIFYSISALLLAISWTTPEVYVSVSRAPWGWRYETGPIFPLLSTYQLVLVAVAIGIAVRHYYREGLLAELEQSRWLALGVVASVVAGLASHTTLGTELSLPRTGSLSFLLLSVLIGGTLRRFGYWILAPGAFEREILATIRNGVVLLREDGRIRIANEGMAHLMQCEGEQLFDVAIEEHLSPPGLLQAGELKERECELRPFGGGSIPVSVSLTRISDKSGQDLGRVMVVADLREIVSLRNRLITSGRLAAVGELAAGVAHEINNPLTYVRANLSMLRQEWQVLEKSLSAQGDLDPELMQVLSGSEEMIEESLEGVDRAAAIVRDVKSFSHAGRSERELADLVPLLDSVLRVAGPQLGELVTLVKRYGDIPMVLCAPQELKQVFLNLVVNAAQAMPEGGTITLCAEVDDNDVIVRISDEGDGIAPEDRSRIFDPFFTTKPVGEGTGLGLALSYEIIRRHRGEISVESAPGRGATFSVRIPIEAAPPTPDDPV